MYALIGLFNLLDPGISCVLHRADKKFKILSLLPSVISYQLNTRKERRCSYNIYVRISLCSTADTDMLERKIFLFRTTCLQLKTCGPQEVKGSDRVSRM